MPAGPTYKSIAYIKTLSTTSSVNFLNIPQIYTDLVLVANPNNAGITSLNIYFNNDTTANYSCTRIFGEGTTVSSDRTTNSTLSLGGWGTGATTAPYLFSINVMNYINTNMWKTALTNVSEPTGGYVGQIVTLWRSTSAINRISFTGNNNFGIGSQFSLYGIAAA